MCSNPNIPCTITCNGLSAIAHQEFNISPNFVRNRSKSMVCLAIFAHVSPTLIYYVNMVYFWTFTYMNAIQCTTQTNNNTKSSACAKQRSTSSIFILAPCIVVHVLHSLYSSKLVIWAQRRRYLLIMVVVFLFQRSSNFRIDFWPKDIYFQSFFWPPLGISILRTMYLYFSRASRAGEQRFGTTHNSSIAGFRGVRIV